MHTKEKKSNSYQSLKARFLISYLITFFLSLCIALLGSRHFNAELSKQTASTSASTLKLHLDTIDAKLEHISTFLMSFLFNESNYESLFQNLSPEESLDRKLFIKEYFDTYLNTYSNADGLFFYLPQSDLFIIASKSQESIYDRQAIKDYVKSSCFSDTNGSLPEIQKWFPFSANHSSFLMQTIGYQNVYIGAYLSSDYISDPLRQFSETSHGTLLLSSDQSESDIVLVESEDTDIQKISSRSDQYLTISSDSNTGNFQLKMMIPRKILLRNGNQFSYTLYLVIVASMLFLIINFLSTWRQIISPLEILTDGMKKLQQGIFNISLPVAKKRNEFSVLTETFNTMSHEIEHLKMQVYENRLKRANTELEYLTLQIKPHFFLNSLNVIYSLAITKHFDLIMEMTSCLMKYFRYLFQSSETLVPLDQELTHTKNYLRIQEMRYGTNFSTDIQADPETISAKIPILSIHTFVENIVKHAYSDSSSILVKIRVSSFYRHGNYYLNIFIEDNGKGFSKDQLILLNNPVSEESLPQHHIGISNVKQRLFYLYQDDFTLIFENNSTGGARVHLMIPCLISERKEV